MAVTIRAVFQACKGDSDMTKRIKSSDLVQVGSVFGNLTVECIAREQIGMRVRPVAYCLRSDGVEVRVRVDHLASGETRGCASQGKWSGAAGQHRSTYRSWEHMLDRCYNERHPHYDRYGGRGITVCDSWRNSFVEFLRDMGERPTGLTLEREDVDANYEPSNCRWATYKEQNRNKTNGTSLEFDGKIMSVTEWAEFLGVRRGVLFGRLNSGWSVEKTLTTPVRKRRWAKRPIEDIKRQAGVNDW